MFAGRLATGRTPDVAQAARGAPPRGTEPPRSIARSRRPGHAVHGGLRRATAPAGSGARAVAADETLDVDEGRSAGSGWRAAVAARCSGTYEPGRSCSQPASARMARETGALGAARRSPSSIASGPAPVRRGARPRPRAVVRERTRSRHATGSDLAPYGRARARRVARPRGRGAGAHRAGSSSVAARGEGSCGGD